MAPVALVTGSGKKRVGWHVADALARRGHALAVHYREQRRGAAVAGRTCVVAAELPGKVEHAAPAVLHRGRIGPVLLVQGLQEPDACRLEAHSRRRCLPHRPSVS